MNPKQYIRDGRAPVPDREATSRTMSAIGSRNTKPELILRQTLWRMGIRGYRLNWKKALGRPDICFPSRKIAIFVHGCFWHRCPYCQPTLPKSHSDFWRKKFSDNVARDLRVTTELKKKGWRVIVWECQTSSTCEPTLRERIREFWEH